MSASNSKGLALKSLLTARKPGTILASTETSSTASLNESEKKQTQISAPVSGSANKVTSEKRAVVKNKELPLAQTKPSHEEKHHERSTEGNGTGFPTANARLSSKTKEDPNTGTKVDRESIADESQKLEPADVSTKKLDSRGKSIEVASSVSRQQQVIGTEKGTSSSRKKVPALRPGASLEKPSGPSGKAQRAVIPDLPQKLFHTDKTVYPANWLRAYGRAHVIKLRDGPANASNVGVDTIMDTEKLHLCPKRLRTIVSCLYDETDDKGNKKYYRPILPNLSGKVPFPSSHRPSAELNGQARAEGRKEVVLKGNAMDPSISNNRPPTREVLRKSTEIWETGDVTQASSLAEKQRLQFEKERAEILRQRQQGADTSEHANPSTANQEKSAITRYHQEGDDIMAELMAENAAQETTISPPQVPSLTPSPETSHQTVDWSTGLLNDHSVDQFLRSRIDAPTQSSLFINADIPSNDDPESLQDFDDTILESFADLNSEILEDGPKIGNDDVFDVTSLISSDFLSSSTKNSSSTPEGESGNSIGATSVTCGNTSSLASIEATLGKQVCDEKEESQNRHSNNNDKLASLSSKISIGSPNTEDTAQSKNFSTKPKDVMSLFEDANLQSSPSHDKSNVKTTSPEVNAFNSGSNFAHHEVSPRKTANVIPVGNTSNKKGMKTPGISAASKMQLLKMKIKAGQNQTSTPVSKGESTHELSNTSTSANAHGEVRVQATRKLNVQALFGAK